MITAASRNGSTHPSAPTPGEVQKTITGRDYISYSEVSSYQRCPLQWKFRYVDKAESEQVSAALIMGSGVHAAIEHHLHAIMSCGELCTIEDLMAVFDECWEAEASKTPVTFPRGQDRDTIRETATRMIQQFLHSPHALPDGQLVGIEENFRVTLADDLPTILGRIDVVTWDGHELLITDFKTARSMWTPATAQENAEQLMLYSVGMRGLANTLSDDAKIALRFVVLTKTKTPKIESLPVKLEQNRLQRTVLTVRNVVTSMRQASEADTIYPNPSQFNCSGCSFKARCRKWHLDE